MFLSIDFLVIFWARRELNPHGLPHKILSLARLPVPPHAPSFIRFYGMLGTAGFAGLPHNPSFIRFYGMLGTVLSFLEFFLDDAEDCTGILINILMKPCAAGFAGLPHNPSLLNFMQNMERAEGFEPSTATLAR